jgi:hypothetical protein
MFTVIENQQKAFVMQMAGQRREVATPLRRAETEDHCN